MADGSDLEVIDGGPGHNSGIDGGALKSYVERVTELMREQKSLAEDIKEICADADEAGVASKKEVRQLARESMVDQDVLRLKLARMDALRSALGPFADTPLGEAALGE